MSDTPSTPSELFALQSSVSVPVPEKLSDLIDQTTLNEALDFTQETLSRLFEHHQDLAEGCCDPAVKRIFQAEADSLLSAMMGVRSVGRSCECEDCQ